MAQCFRCAYFVTFGRSGIEDTTAGALGAFRGFFLTDAWLWGLAGIQSRFDLDLKIQIPTDSRVSTRLYILTNIHFEVAD
jgi:hypothetical protein